MTDRVEPVMSREQWDDLTGFELPGDSNLPELIALANAALKDDDPRKLTRERLAALEEVIGAAVLWNHAQRKKGRDMQPGEHALDLVADLYHALQSYLPPDREA